MEPVSVENERSYCPFGDLETSGRGQVEDLLVSGVTDVDILTCARNKERLMMMKEWHIYLIKENTDCVEQTAEGCGSCRPGPRPALSTSMVQRRPWGSSEPPLSVD